MYLRRVLSILVVSMFLLASYSFAGEINGKKLFRANCHVCHGPGSTHGVFTPMSKTQAQWRSFFNTKFEPSHKTFVNPQTGQKLFGLTPAEMRALQRFAIDHAADSEQPATCG